MAGTVTKLKTPKKEEALNQEAPEKILLGPELAAQLLEHNKLNRPISSPHVERLVRQIEGNKWRYNGDTIKIADTGDVLDGQHRLWAVIEAQKAIETIVVYGIDKEAFATIDTIRKPRSGADILYLHGLKRNRKAVSMALAWLLRFQGETVQDYRAPQNRIENADIEEAFEAHPEMVRAVERAAKVRSIVNPAIMGFIYYITANRNPDLAERLMTTLENPAGVGVSDPFYKLRAYLLTAAGRGQHMDPVITIAVCIKAINAAFKDEKVNVLLWRNQGAKAEQFPVLKV